MPLFRVDVDNVFFQTPRHIRPKSDPQKTKKTPQNTLKTPENWAGGAITITENIVQYIYILHATINKIKKGGVCLCKEYYCAIYNINNINIKP